MRKLVGSGLTRYAVDILPPDKWRKKAAQDPQFLARALSSYPERLLVWQKWATDVLAKAKRPTTNEPVVVGSDGTWTRAEFLPNAQTGKVRIKAGLSLSDEEEESSIEWYAAKILTLINHELDLLRSQEPVAPPQAGEQEKRLAELASRGTAAELGATIERVRWKFSHESAALAGYQNMERTAEFQKRGAAAKRTAGTDKTLQIEPLYRRALKGSSKSLSALTVAAIVKLMLRVDPKQAKGWSPTTLRRHVERLRNSDLKKITTSA